MKFVELEQVSKRIGNQQLLSNINLTLEKGKIYGIMGENGSGKTMLLRVLAGLLQMDEGSVKYKGKNIKKLTDEIGIGLTLENVGLYEDMTLKQNLKYYSKISGKVDYEQINEVVEQVGLTESMNVKFDKYSLGMKQRAVIAQAILGKPELLLLDEPTNGLDKDGKERIKQILEDEKERGCCIVLVSHELSFFSDILDFEFEMNCGKLERR